MCLSFLLFCERPKSDNILPIAIKGGKAIFEYLFCHSSANNKIYTNTVKESYGYNSSRIGVGIHCLSSEVANFIYNNIYNNQTYNLQTDISPGSQTAILNWWGTAVEADIKAKLSGNIIYKPYLAGTFTGSNISIVPTSGITGNSVAVEGIAFGLNKEIFLSFDTHQTITTTQSNQNGTFSATFIVDTQTPGTKVITAQDSSGNLATTVFILLPPTFLKVVPSYDLIARNQEFDVDVRIEDVRNLAAVQAYLLYNPNLLEVIGIQNGSFPSGAFVSTKTTAS